MRFEPISTLPSACPLFVEDAYKALVGKLGVKSWHWSVPRTASELERFLLYGTARSLRSDFFELRSTHPGYSFLDVFDHAICFKGIMGAPFALVMPYGNNETFHNAFEAFKAGYYKDKARVANAPRSKTYSTRSWTGQLYTKPRFDTTIVPNWFKVRENGDFAAIIAMDNWLYALSERGGFSLVNAHGVER